MPETRRPTLFFSRRRRSEHPFHHVPFFERGRRGPGGIAEGRAAEHDMGIGQMEPGKQPTDAGPVADPLELIDPNRPDPQGVGCEKHILERTGAVFHPVRIVPFVGGEDEHISVIKVVIRVPSRFFPDHGGLVMTCLYVFGMLVGIIAAKVLSKTAFTGKPVPFVMELPNYRMPSLKSVLLLMWEKAWDFIRRAFTVIFAATIVIWFLQHFDVRLNVVGEGSTDSLLAIIGTWISPVFAPLGFGDWRVATALLTGLMAKEAVISTLGVLMNVGANLGSAALGGLFTLPSAVSFLVFCLLYTPCVAALAALRRELGSGVKTVLVMISQCCVAWLAAFCVYALIGVIF